MIPPWRSDGRWAATALVLLFGLGFALGARRHGMNAALEAVGVAPMSAHFTDLYTTPAARFEFQRGGNPYVSNPMDPWGRPLNFPRIWLVLMRYPWSAVPAIGLGLGAAWLIAAFGSLGRISPATGLIAGAALCSPPALLALERANSDLLIFILLALSLACLRRERPVGGWLILLVAALLKLYPLAGFAAFLTRGRRRGTGWIIAAALVLAVWCLVQLPDLRAIWHNTPYGGPAVSYGAGVLLSAADMLHYDGTGAWGNFVRFAPAAQALAALAGAALACLGARRPAAAVPAAAAFLAGAAIYGGTYLIGSNFVYREIFLIFCLPWLGGGAGGRAGRAAIVCLLLSLWINPMWGATACLTFLRLGANAGLFLLLAWLGGRAAANAGKKSRSNPTGVPV
ncbi:MAG TPA: glycosyltransferase family 87 protein [Opitutaceae bacterium]|nr:glycosyltransferase family 87 protein [Opitutaceae bacterium]